MSNDSVLDETIKEMRLLFKEGMKLVNVCRKLGVNEKFFYKHCSDLVEMRQQEKSLLKDKIRDLYLNHHFSYDDIQEKLDVSKSTISKYCRDLVDERYPRAKTLRKKQHSQETAERARALYQEGNSINKVAELLMVSHQSVRNWCADLISKKKRIKVETINEELKERKKPKPVFGIRSTKRRLTDEQVIAMRREIRETGIKNLKKFTERFNVSTTTISWAIHGKTYKQINHIEPPIGEGIAHNYARSENPRFKLSDDLKQQIIDKRKQDPYTWSYKTLSMWLAEQTGKKYKSTHVAKILFTHDPSLKELEKFDAPKEVRPRKQSVKTPKPKPVKKEMHPAIKTAMLKARRDKARRQREALQRMIEEEERYEREIQALAS